jgi:hypothetical protein
MEYELQRRRIGWNEVLYRHLPGETEETQEHFSLDNKYSDRDSNRKPPKSIFFMLVIQRRRQNRDYIVQTPILVKAVIPRPVSSAQATYV